MLAINKPYNDSETVEIPNSLFGFDLDMTLEPNAGNGKDHWKTFDKSSVFL